MDEIVCGIDISGFDVFIVILKGSRENFEFINTKTSKIVLQDDKVQDNIKAFMKTFENFVKLENVNRIAIKARATKGKFSGGSITFKIEALIQTINIEVQVLHANSISAKFKKSNIDLESFKIYKYQSDAFKAAYYLLKESSIT